MHQKNWENFSSCLWADIMLPSSSQPFSWNFHNALLKIRWLSQNIFLPSKTANKSTFFSIQCFSFVVFAWAIRNRNLRLSLVHLGSLLVARLISLQHNLCAREHIIFAGQTEDISTCMQWGVYKSVYVYWGIFAFAEMIIFSFWQVAHFYCHQFSKFKVRKKQKTHFIPPFPFHFWWIIWSSHERYWQM